MEPQTEDIYIGDRLSSFQAAAACIGIAPILRRAGRFCLFAGGISLGLLLLNHQSTDSLFFWVALALFGFGVYLHLPNPKPLALPVAAIVILAVLADGIYFEYQQWRQFHIPPRGDGIGIIIEILLAVSLFGSYLTYKRNLSATDLDTMSRLREFAIALNRSNLEENAEIIELTQKNNRLRLRKLDRYILLAARHYVAFGKYSKLDAVVIQTPEAVTIEAVGTSKPNKPLKFRFSCPPIKMVEVKLKPQYLPRISSLGLTITGLPMSKQDQDITQKEAQTEKI